MSNRKMIKFEKTELCIAISVIHKDNSEQGKPIRAKRSNKFYVPRESLRPLLENEDSHILQRDLYSFAILQRVFNELNIEFSWLRLVNYSELSGYIEEVAIPWEIFEKWYYDDSRKVLKVIENPGHRSPKITFCTNSVHLKDVVANPTIKKKFVNMLKYFMDFSCDEVKFYDDFVPYSFGWCCYKNGKLGMSGGLIFHRNSTKDLLDGYYKIHT